MANVVVLMEKYCDLNPSLGETSAYYNIVGSLLSAGINPEVFHYDEYLINNGTEIDNFIIDKFNINKPDYVVSSYYPFYDQRNIKTSTFDQIKQMGIPVIFIWFDFGHEHIKNLANDVGRSASLNVVVDTFNQVDGNFIPMWVPQDERIFCNNQNKDINVCFSGSTNGYEVRRTYLNFLKNNTNIYVSGGQREHCLTLQQYAEVLKRSKISLNFPDKPDGIIQAKCRIYESMLCGCLLMEKENKAIEKWFQPFIHYVPFSNENDLLNKINYYLQNEQARMEIVNNATEKMKNEYSSAKWWEKVFEKSK